MIKALSLTNLLLHVTRKSKTDIEKKKRNMSVDHMREPLMKKNRHYYQDCPGCKVEQAKELNQGVSVTNLLIIWMVVLSSSNQFSFFRLQHFSVLSSSLISVFLHVQHFLHHHSFHSCISW